MSKTFPMCRYSARAARSSRRAQARQTTEGSWPRRAGPVRKWNPPSTLPARALHLSDALRNEAKLAGPQRPFLPPTREAFTAASPRNRSLLLVPWKPAVLRVHPGVLIPRGTRRRGAGLGALAIHTPTIVSRRQQARATTLLGRVLLRDRSSRRDSGHADDARQPFLGPDVWGRDARRLRTERFSGRQVLRFAIRRVSDVSARPVCAIASRHRRQRQRGLVQCSVSRKAAVGYRLLAGMASSRRTQRANAPLQHTKR